jgi:uncharacterized protein (DUF4415 family)
MSENRKPSPKPLDQDLPLTDDDGEVREMTLEDFSAFRSTRDLVPEVVERWEKTRGRRGPQKAPVKERVGLRLNRDVVEHFRQTGPGWQSRINDVLEDYVKAREN